MKTFKKQIRFAAALLCFVACTLAASAQSLPPTLVSLGQINPSPVLHQNGNELFVAVYPDGALSYHEYTDFSNPMNPKQRGHFVYNKGAAAIHQFDLPDSIFATDFRPVATTGYIAFCGKKLIVNVSPSGYTSHTYHGIVGWFELPTSAGDSVRFKYLEYLDIYTFLKVQPYRTPQGDYDIAATALTYDNWSERLIVHIKDILPYNYPSYNYQKYVLGVGNYIYDILLTDQYVVFVGTDNILGGLCLRREKKSALGNPILLNTIHAFPYAEDKDMQSIHAAHIGNHLKPMGDTIAVCLNTIFSPTDIHARTRFIDVDAMTMLDAQEFLMHDKINVKGIDYVCDAKHLCILTTDNPVTSAQGASVVLLNPFTNVPYTAKFFYRASSLYSNINCLNYSTTNALHFLLGNGNEWLLQNAASYNSLCMKTHSIDIKPLPIVQELHRVDNLNIDTLNILANQIKKTSYCNTPSTICQ